MEEVLRIAFRVLRNRTSSHHLRLFHVSVIWNQRDALPRDPGLNVRQQFQVRGRKARIRSGASGVARLNA
jgi:hypothetical protein